MGRRKNLLNLCPCSNNFVLCFQSLFTSHLHISITSLACYGPPYVVQWGVSTEHSKLQFWLLIVWHERGNFCLKNAFSLPSAHLTLHPPLLKTPSHYFWSGVDTSPPSPLLQPRLWWPDTKCFLVCFLTFFSSSRCLDLVKISNNRPPLESSCACVNLTLPITFASLSAILSHFRRTRPAQLCSALPGSHFCLGSTPPCWHVETLMPPPPVFALWPVP